MDATLNIAGAVRAAPGTAGALVPAAVVSAILLWLSSRSGAAGWIAWVALVPAAAVALRARTRRFRRMTIPLTFAVYLELLLVPALPFGIAEGRPPPTPPPPGTRRAPPINAPAITPPISAARGMAVPRVTAKAMA